MLRQPVLVLRRECAYMNAATMGARPPTASGEVWELFELTIFSNRQLVFEKLSPPFFFGTVE